MLVSCLYAFISLYCYVRLTVLALLMGIFSELPIIDFYMLISNCTNSEVPCIDFSMGLDIIYQSIIEYHSITVIASQCAFRSSNLGTARICHSHLLTLMANFLLGPLVDPILTFASSFHFRFSARCTTPWIFWVLRKIAIYSLLPLWCTVRVACAIMLLRRFLLIFCASYWWVLEF